MVQLNASTLSSVKMARGVAPKTERVIQFGEGGFLRAFCDWMIDMANEKAGMDAGVVIVQPIERGMVSMLNEQDGLYTLILRGQVDGKPSKDERIIQSVKRGLFSNEAGSGSAPCAAAAADVSHPAKAGLLQALGVFIDTIVICSCTAFIMLVTPAADIQGLEGMGLLQASMEYHLGQFGVIFIAVILWLFSFSTFIGILFYARSNVAYLFGDNWVSQTGYKILALIMLFVGGLATYTFVWDLGDVGIGLMTIFNILVILPMSKEALASLREYEQEIKERKRAQ